MSVAAINAKVALAMAARESGDYAAAIGCALDVKLLIAATPNTNRSAGGGSQSITWNPAAIDQFIAECKQSQANAAVAATGGIRRTSVTYTRAASSDAYQ